MKTAPVGGLPLVAYVLVLLVPALALYRKPGAGRAWLWLAWNFVELVVGFAIAIYEALQHMTFGGGSSDLLWPGWAVGAGMLAIQVYLFVVLPITIVRSRGPRLPRAQVVEAP